MKPGRAITLAPFRLTAYLAAVLTAHAVHPPISRTTFRAGIVVALVPTVWTFWELLHLLHII